MREEDVVIDRRRTRSPSNRSRGMDDVGGDRRFKEYPRSHEDRRPQSFTEKRDTATSLESMQDRLGSGRRDDRGGGGGRDWSSNSRDGRNNDEYSSSFRDNQFDRRYPQRSAPGLVRGPGPQRWNMHDDRGEDHSYPDRHRFPARESGSRSSDPRRSRVVPGRTGPGPLRKQREPVRDTTYDYLTPRSDRYFQHDDRADMETGRPRKRGFTGRKEADDRWHHDKFATEGSPTHELKDAKVSDAPQESASPDAVGGSNSPMENVASPPEVPSP